MALISSPKEEILWQLIQGRKEISFIRILVL